MTKYKIINAQYYLSDVVDNTGAYRRTYLTLTIRRGVSWFSNKVFEITLAGEDRWNFNDSKATKKFFFPTKEELKDLIRDKDPYKPSPKPLPTEKEAEKNWLSMIYDYYSDIDV
jgi:hypothetical protein